MMLSASLPANRWLVLVAVMLAFLPVVLDMTILHVAVPTLTQSLNASGIEVPWIIEIYRAIELPSHLSPALAEQASRTIGDAYIIAGELPGEQGAALIEAGKAAFTQTHAVLLTTAAAVIAALAVVVFFTLAGYRRLSRAHH